MIQSELPTLRYLVRIRVVEVQDWNAPPPSDDDESPGDFDQLDQGNRGNPWPRRFWYGNADGEPIGEASDPQLGPGWGPTFQQATPVVVGSILCLIFLSLGLTGGTRRKQGPLLREAQRRLHLSRRFRLSSCPSIEKKLFLVICGSVIDL